MVITMPAMAIYKIESRIQTKNLKGAYCKRNKLKDKLSTNNKNISDRNLHNFSLDEEVVIIYNWMKKIIT